MPDDLATSFKEEMRAIEEAFYKGELESVSARLIALGNAGLAQSYHTGAALAFEKLALVQGLLLRSDEAHESIRTAERLARRSGDSEVVRKVELRKIFYESFFGSLRDAIRRSVVLLNDSAFSQGEDRTWLFYNLGLCYAHLGRTADALTSYVEGISGARRRGDLNSVAHLQYGIARCLNRVGWELQAKKRGVPTLDLWGSGLVRSSHIPVSADQALTEALSTQELSPTLNALLRFERAKNRYLDGAAPTLQDVESAARTLYEFGRSSGDLLFERNVRLELAQYYRLAGRAADALGAIEGLEVRDGGDSALVFSIHLCYERYQAAHGSEESARALEQCLALLVRWTQRSAATVMRPHFHVRAGSDAAGFTPTRESERLNAALDFIARHLAERLSIESVATAAGVSKRTLQGLFRKVLDQSPLEFITDRRLHFMRVLLQEGRASRSIESAARAAGISRMAGLAGRYRELFGELPSETRARSLKR